jgi:hypothetical protein
MLQKISPDVLYKQAVNSWIVRGSLLRQSTRIKKYGTKNPGHLPFLNMSWVEAAVFSVYTGYVLLDRDLKPRYRTFIRTLRKTGYQEITFGSDPDMSHFVINGLLPDNYGLGQMLYKDVCHYDKIRRLNLDNIEAYGAGLIQYKSGQPLTDLEKSDYKRELEQNGTAHVAFTDKETSIEIMSVKCDWEGIKIEMEETRIAIEQSLWGSDTRKSATLVAEIDQSESLQGVVAGMFDDQVKKVAKLLFDIDLEFVNRLDSLKDLELLSASVAVSDAAVQEVTGQKGLVEGV